MAGKMMETSTSSQRSSSRETSSAVVLNQCRDLLALQEMMLSSSLQRLNEERASRPQVTLEEYEALQRQLQGEKFDHAQTRAALHSESEKYEFAITEVDVLRKQLEREKGTFEHAFGLLKSQALADSSKVESILAKCTALEALCLKKDEELVSKNEDIRQLEKKLREAKETHKRTVQELNVRIQQEKYLAREMSSTEPHLHGHSRNRVSKRKGKLLKT